MAHYDGDRPSPTATISMTTSCIWANSVQISSFDLLSSFGRLSSSVRQWSFPIHSLDERKGSPPRSRHQSLPNFALKYLVLLSVLCTAALSAITIFRLWLNPPQAQLVSAQHEILPWVITCAQKLKLPSRSRNPKTFHGTPRRRHGNHNPYPSRRRRNHSYS